MILDFLFQVLCFLHYFKRLLQRIKIVRKNKTTNYINHERWNVRSEQRSLGFRVAHCQRAWIIRWILKIKRIRSNSLVRRSVPVYNTRPRNCRWHLARVKSLEVSKKENVEMVFLFVFFQSKGVNLTCVRNCVVVAEERPRINLTTAFSTLFSGLGLSPRAVSTSFGCRVNVAICTQVKMLISSIVNVLLQITCHKGRWHIGVKVLLSVISVEGYVWYQFSK